MERADAIIIGSGQGGVPLAVNLARAGKSVVLFEKGSFGGSCVNYGCIPSKAFLASAYIAGIGHEAQGLGIKVQVEVDFLTVMERTRGVAGSTSNRLKERVEKAGVRLIHAEASFTGERTVTGGDITVESPLIVINTGKSPFIPLIPGLEATPCLNYINFWDMREMPQRMLVIGGGYIGVELGQGMARLGSKTHIIEKMDRIIAFEEPDVSQVLTEELEKDGIQFHLGVEVTHARYASGVFTITLSNNQELEGEALLLAIGQRPNTVELNAQAAGIELDERGNVKVDSHFRTTAPGVYAIGDVTGQPAFTHVSWEDFRRLMAILEGKDRTQGDRVLGYAFFTEPEVGRAGLTLEQARNKGFNARAVTLPLESVQRARLTGRTHGFYRMVVDKDTDRILGATLVGPTSAELIHVFVDLMEAGATWQLLEQAVHIHPTFAEGLPSLARLLTRER